MCGALHICWPTEEGVSGRYMICLLYRDVLCLASTSKVDPIYTLQAIIVLNEAKIEDASNGRGERVWLNMVRVVRLTRIHRTAMSYCSVLLENGIQE